MENSSAANLTDDELISLYKKDCNEQALLAIISRYSSLVRNRALHYCGSVSEAEDYIQEALIALFCAVEAYDGNSSAFATFARVCIDRRLLSVLRTKYAAGKIPSELTVEYDDEFDTDFTENDPQNMLAATEGYKALLTKLKAVLSPFEKSVLLQLLNGLSYSETAEKLSTTVKSVDNAVQRVRKKFKK